MKGKTPPETLSPKRQTQQRHYQKLTAQVNDAMTAVLDTLKGMSHDDKMRVLAAVVKYGEAEHIRARMAEHMKATARTEASK